MRRSSRLFERWQTLSPHAQRISRYVVCDSAESVVGEGVSHPQRAERERLRDEQFATMDAQAAQEYRTRS